MHALDIQAQMAPVSEALPCGEDLDSDPSFQALEVAARGKPEQQFGETLIAAQAPEWPVMQELALGLLQRTRDLRIAMHVLRAMTRLQGFSGFASGVQLVRGLLQQHWTHVHPQLDASDHDDPTARLNALAPLAHADAVIADLRAAYLGHPREGILVRQVEVGLRKAEPLRGEPVPTEAGVRTALLDAEKAAPGLADQIAATHEHLGAIDRIVTDKLGPARGPDLRPLMSLTGLLLQATQSRVDAGSAQDAASAGSTANQGAPVQPPQAPAHLSGITSRDHALRTLDLVCEWITQHEPTNPAPLLIRRAQRLMNKNFMDIVRDLAPEGLKEVERIAGVTSE
jgi:type VI secretion system protein ImpA